MSRHLALESDPVIPAGHRPLSQTVADWIAQRIISGESAPDFSAENFEVDFEGRATVGDLTELGQRQMGLATW